jgi:glycosyltransferase involved in cell wall biosynthesis
MNRLRLLFVKESQSWPRSSGHDVHGYHMMQALAARGHAVSLATIEPPTSQALEGLKLERRYGIDGEVNTKAAWSHWQRRFTNYFGVKEQWAASLATLLSGNRFDAVIVVARHLLPLLAAVKQGVRIWYPADDPAWHHLSRLKLLQLGTWNEARQAVVNGLFEHAFRRSIDRVWVVSPADRRAMRLITACREVDLIPNGVDANYYRPGAVETIPTSCVFWGRLDFGPNVDALAWFLKSIWPTVKAAHPAATFHVFGFSPTSSVLEMTEAPGVELHRDLPDLRQEVSRRQVVVLPFISGGGIKNKLLEAAAMAMPIVCSGRALSGMKGMPPVRVVHWPFSRQWSAALGELWASPRVRSDLGGAAREWVVANHSWESAAGAAEAGIRKSLGRTR